MKIVAVRARNVGFSQAPDTLRRHLVSSTSHFDDSRTKPTGWFGDVFATIVEVETNDGIRGVGTAGAFGGGAKAIIELYLADLIVGEDPRRHEYLWQRMHRTLARFGSGAPVMSAISAIDIACWDAHGRAEEKSVIDLLGGAAQSTVPVYASRLYALEDKDALAEEARSYVAEGFTRMKQRFGFGPSDGRAGVEQNLDLVRVVREAVGDTIELAADAYMGWNLAYAIEIADRARELKLSWIEEPLMPGQVEGYAELARRVPWQRWSCGEHSYGKLEFKRLIDQRATDILQPDTNRIGGITEARKICALAEAAGLPVVFHSNEMHNLVITFSQSNTVCPVIEYFPDRQPDTGNELFWQLFSGNPIQVDGSLSIDTTRPGLGVDLNEELAKELVCEEGNWCT